MKKLEIHIATTGGPARIERLTAEDPDVHSVICLTGTAIALPVSHDYHAFVRRPTGVIEAHFGHGAWRLDISKPIASGLSWQLGAFIAHAAREDARLAETGQPAKMLLWVTGEVNHDLAVEPVTEIEQKLLTSESLFIDAMAKGLKIVVVVPADNAHEAQAVLARLAGGLANVIDLIPAATTRDVLSALRIKSQDRQTARKASGKGLRKPALALAASLAALAVFAWQQADSGIETHPAIGGAPAPAITATALGLRAPVRSGCEDVLFSIVAPEMVTSVAGSASRLPRLAARTLCDFRYRIRNVTGAARNLWVLATRSDVSGGNFRTRTLNIASPLAANATIDIDARPPPRLNRPLRQELILFTADRNVARSDMAGILLIASQARSEAELRPAITQAKSRGVEILRLTQEFSP